jgi:SAM-dependent methyltransferase
VQTFHTRIDCPICGAETESLAHGVVAPFISELSSLPFGQQTTLRCCASCDLIFFDARYGDLELSRLYENYRGRDYMSIRRHWEPWYSNKINDAYAPGADHVNERSLFMMGVLNDAKLNAHLECVVDFGGDEGQFFPTVPIARRIVCDVSNRDLPPGIERIAALSELGGVKPDLVVIAHVLEHLPDPIQPLMEIRRVIADDGLLYVEIPLDRFRVNRFHATTRYERYLGGLVRHRVPFVASDFLSGVSRQYRSSIPRFGVVKQSEHINYFSARAVEAALSASGFTVVAECSNEHAKTGGLRIGSYGAAARPI